MKEKFEIGDLVKVGTRTGRILDVKTKTAKVVFYGIHRENWKDSKPQVIKVDDLVSAKKKPVGRPKMVLKGREMSVIVPVELDEKLDRKISARSQISYLLLYIGGELRAEDIAMIVEAKGKRRRG